MKEKHVVLRAIGAKTRTTFLGGGSAAVEPSGIAVEVDELDKTRIPDVVRKNDVLAVAPVMPMKLIEPTSTTPVEASGLTADWGIPAVGADASPFSGDGVVVAILDTGIDHNHPAFAGVTLVQKNFTADSAGHDTHGHGTHCAGTVFGRDVDGARIGVARGTKKALIGKVLGPGGGASDQLAEAIQWALFGGANIISMSLGMDFPKYQEQLVARGLPSKLATSRALHGYGSNIILFQSLAATVKSMGEFRQATILVAAAGNESRRNENPDFEIAVSPPAAAQGFISVAALGRAPGGLRIADFSNIGATVAAPGVDIVSAKPGGGLVAMSGTSMATPYVAGVAALWTQKLKMMGSLNATLLASRVVGSGETSPLEAGFDPADVGTGLVRAPRN